MDYNVFNLKLWNHPISFALYIICTQACINTKNVTYFNNLPDSLQIQLAKIQPPQQLIQVNDLLTIRVGGENEKSVAYINQFFGGVAGGGNSGIASGLQSTVDINGNIELPKIGKVKVEGLTRDAARDVIRTAYGEYLKDPIVSVIFGNFKYTILGEVRAPGYYTTPNEKLNVFEALAQAGDMTPYAKKDNVKLIREANGERKIISLNFNDRSILNSSDYYVQRYDVIYVEPKSQRFFSDNFSRTTAILSAATSLTALLIIILRK
jgi:polysaccharide export outer membrane protein